MTSRIPRPAAAGQRVSASNGDTAPEAQAKLSFSEQKAQKGRPQRKTPLVEGTPLMRQIDRAPPGDVVRKASKTQSKAELARKRSNLSFFEDAFSENQESPARARVLGDSMVMAEVKTNVIVRDEFTFITELSYHLSQRYQRPVSSIVVTLHHGACMVFGGTFDPAYVMAVCALPAQLLPTTNRRNAALIQRHMHEALGVPPARGLLRFVPTREEHLACNGKTVAGEIDELERGAAPPSGVGRGRGGGDDDDGGGGGGDGNAGEGAGAGAGAGLRSAKVRKGLSVRQNSLASIKSSPSAANLPTTSEPTPPASADADDALPPVPESPTPPDRREATATPQTEPESLQPKTARRKKSFIASIFGRSGSRMLRRSSLPAISGGR